jgi:hypothetical protein
MYTGAAELAPATFDESAITTDARIAPFLIADFFTITPLFLS